MVDAKESFNSREAGSAALSSHLLFSPQSFREGRRNQMAGGFAS